MKILRTMGILALVAGLVLGGAGSVFAQGQPKRGFFGTVSSVTTITSEEEYVIELDTADWGTVDITADDTTKYMVPRETRGPKGLDRFLEIVDEGDNGHLEELVDRRLAVLAANVVGDPPNVSGDAVRLMLIPSHSSPPSHAHRVGIVDAFTAGSSITINDKDGEPHTFDLDVTTVYRPELTESGDIVVGSPVTVVTTGDPKLGTAIAKAIVLHDELPDWAP